jgi:hypothetical protein
MTTDMKCSEIENKSPGVGAIDNPLDDYARQFRSHMERQHYCPATRRVDASDWSMKRIFVISEVSAKERSSIAGGLPTAS